MSVKLTDSQLVMMSAAAQREDRCLAAPETMKGAVVSKAGAKLVKLGFAREILAKPGAPLWRRDETGRSSAVSGRLRVNAPPHGGGVVFRPRGCPWPGSDPRRPNWSQG